MSYPRLLVIEGNTAEARARQRAMGCQTYAEGYANLLRMLTEADITICQPADRENELFDIQSLATYDGAVLTGSWLNIYDKSPSIARQIELVRRIFLSGTPYFGSCWGLQVAAVVAGGRVRRHPKGREIGIALPIYRTVAGHAHPLLAHKPDPYRAITVHLDEVEHVPPGMTVLAWNEWTKVQVAGWAVQYHPEFSFTDIALIIRRYTAALIEQQLFDNEQEVIDYSNKLACCASLSDNLTIGHQLGVDNSVLDPVQRTREIVHWIDQLVLPTRQRRGR
jgi:GMP synthase (glutamine-hydrolysing)